MLARKVHVCLRVCTCVRAREWRKSISSLVHTVPGGSPSRKYPCTQCTSPSAKVVQYPIWHASHVAGDTVSEPTYCGRQVVLPGWHKCRTSQPAMAPHSAAEAAEEQMSLQFELSSPEQPLSAMQSGSSQSISSQIRRPGAAMSAVATRAASLRAHDQYKS